MTDNTNIHADHALVASAILSSASGHARQAHEWESKEPSYQYAQILATIGLAEAVLAVAHEIRGAHAA
jgi:hypothetical protein